MALDVYDDGATPAPESDAEPGAARPYVSILFECCNVYARVYRRPDDDAYHGRCPKCLRPVRLRVGPDGTPARIFRAR